MDSKYVFPDYIFESSWEVCNKIGGIYAVLSTRAKTLQDNFKDRIIYILRKIYHCFGYGRIRLRQKAFR